MNIWQNLKLKQYWNNFYLFAFATILIFYAIRLPYIWLLFVLFLFVCFKRKLFFKNLLIWSLFVFMLGVLTFNQHSSEKAGPVSHLMVEISSIQLKSEYNGLYLKYKNEYFYAIVDKKDALEPGQVLSVTGKLVKPEGKDYYGDFDYQDYLWQKNIYFIIEITEYTIKDKTFCLDWLHFKIQTSLHSRLDSIELGFIEPLVLGVKDSSSEVHNQLDTMSLSYLLSLSGIYIYLLYRFLFRFFFHITHRMEISEWIVMGILFFNIAFLGFKSSSTRAFLFLFIGWLNRRFILKLSKLDIWSISLMLCVLFNPKSCFSFGFILTYLVTLGLILLPPSLIPKSKLKNGLCRSGIVICLILPICSFMSGSYNLLSIIMGLLFTPLYAYVVFPLAYLQCFLTIDILKNFFHLLFLLQMHVSTLKINIYFPVFKMEFLFLYYLLFLILLYGLFKQKKRAVFPYLFFIVLFFNLETLNPFGEVTFIHVGTGDSIYIRLPYNKGNILIDSYQDNLRYLESKGVTKIDYAIITHSDEDHMGSILEVAKQIPIQTLFYSAFDTDMRQHEVRKYVKSFTPLKKNDTFSLEGYSFTCLSPFQSHKDKNANSIVLYAKLGLHSYLFTGDMTIENEEDVEKAFPLLDVDILKVAHHGSMTSSGESFLKRITPSYSIISVGNKNRYNLPNYEVIHRLETFSTPLITAECGNISFYFNKNETRLYLYRKKTEIKLE